MALLKNLHICLTHIISWGVHIYLLNINEGIRHIVLFFCHVQLHMAKPSTNQIG